MLSKRAGRRRVSVIAPISTYLQRATCFTDSQYIITSEETGGGERSQTIFKFGCTVVSVQSLGFIIVVVFSVLITLEDSSLLKREPPFKPLTA